MEDYINQFNNDGFVCLRNILTDEEVNLVNNMANLLFNLPEVNDSYMKYYEKNNSNILSRVEKFYNLDQNFKFFIDTKLKPILEEITNRELYLFKDKINWKQPGGGEFKAHRDFKAWSNFNSNYFVTIAICVDNCTLENGCLQMARGKNKNIFEENSGLLSEFEINELNWEPIQTSIFDILIFDGLVPHKSSINNSQNTRRMFYFTYSPVEFGDLYEQYFEIKRKEMPPPFERNNNTIINPNSIYNLGNPIG